VVLSKKTPSALQATFPVFTALQLGPSGSGLLGWSSFLLVSKFYHGSTPSLASLMVKSVEYTSE